VECKLNDRWSDISAGYLCAMKVWAVQVLEAANDTSGNSSFSKSENWKLRQDLPHCDNVSRKIGLGLIRPAKR